MFKLIKKIESKTGELHFCRWRILETPWFSIYLHLIAKSDEDKHHHNHPWNFWSIVLLGGYEEEVIDESGNGVVSRTKQFVPRYRKTNTFHKITLLEPTISLVITGERYANWYYWIRHDHKVTNNEYRFLKNQGLLND
jgi:hypothetical protein